MTIEMLLSHRAGIFDHTGLEAFWDSLVIDPRKTWTSEEILALVQGRIPTADFGSFAYSNTGYHLLGMIVEAATGSTVSDEIERRILGPLGLGRTALRRDGHLEPPYAGGYTMIPPDSGIVSDTSTWNFSWDWTAGAAVSTGSDMLGLASALFGGRILEPATLERMIRPLDAGGYGFGIGSLTDTETFHATLIGHSGQNPGTSTLWYHFPEYRTTLFVAVTRSDAQTRPDQTVLVDGMSTASTIFVEAWKILRGW
jgi:D-alanyl-D-alanine carboxypeptidase